MKAVNLIPAELRRGDTSAGHSGGLVYVVLGVLAVLVVLAAVHTGFGKIADERKAEATALQAEATKIEARAGALAHYETAAAAARDRVQKVRALAAGRFEWAHTFREVSRILPNEAWVTSMIGTVGSTVSVEGSGNPLRAGEQAPALELSGCTRRQDSVAKLMAQLRAMDHVTRVALSASEKSDDKGSSGASGTAAAPTDGDCRGGTDRPRFDLVVFFRPTAQAPTATGGTAAASTPAAAAGSTGTSTTPAPAPASGTDAAPTTPSTTTGAAQ